MAFLDWKPEYSIGDTAVDDEHRGMIATINAAFARLGASAENAEMERRLEEIFGVIASHFRSEERIMQAAAYDEYTDHKEDHDALLGEIRALIDEQVVAPRPDVGRVETCLSDWMSRHFATFDARLHGKL